ncbi:hypothetical protein CEUSTIGMA_g10670.t1 [Chlamydomonas eustigma]|uniref:Uncharacterized protein n=1 Tax=Chlamydomonas eustigma TaxID=1157962 RepID=A0A250XJJ2_9CHLO|nr:hypothetical protein CEUSTIGMA_g10670.t1 [Chlamydomonas eustigma]|eukprot:GAX83244.1 hypothetical protein CEUSTIGMA_g10670.t1 [Chlamydomonas eustigma]
MSQKEDLDNIDPGQPYKSSPNGIQHNPRKRASGPGFNLKDLQLLEETSAPTATTSGRDLDPGTVFIQIRERRYGPEFVKYGCYAGAAAVAYTYLNGFLHLFKNNRQGWANTFRHRMFILSPVLTLYACGNGVVPMPFKRHIEKLVGRPALSTMDIYDAREYMQKKNAANMQQ